MKYKDGFRHMKGGRDKYGNSFPQPLSKRERQESHYKRQEDKFKRTFVDTMYRIDKHWVKTLTKEEIEDLYNSWNHNQFIKQTVKNSDDPSTLWFSGEEGDGSYKTIRDFVEAKKSNYGDSIKARDLKIDDLIKD